MRENGCIHTFEDQRFQRAMVKGSLAVLAGGLFLGVCWFLFVVPSVSALPAVELPGLVMGTASGLDMGTLGTVPSLAAWILALCAVTALSLAAHELIHGALFKLFAPPSSRVTFGVNASLGMLYACAEGIVYTRRQYLAIALAPTVVVTAVSVAALLLSPWPVLVFAACVLHLSGCTGDWGYAGRIMRDTSITHCEDTAWGVRFYAADAGSADR